MAISVHFKRESPRYESTRQMPVESVNECWRMTIMIYLRLVKLGNFDLQTSRTPGAVEIVLWVQIICSLLQAPYVRI